MLKVLCDMFPQAPVYTLLYDEQATKGVFKDRYLVTSFLQNFPFSRSHHYFFPLLMPLAVEQFDLSDYDLVISISASFAKGIVVKPHTKHICLCLTPTRFLWDNSQRYVEEFNYPWWVKKILPPFLTYVRVWDQAASKRVDQFWAISNFVKDRIQKYYRAESKLIYPPVDTDSFSAEGGSASGRQIKNYFLMVGRMVPYKKFDLAIEAFNKLGLPLKVVGVGPQIKRLEKIAGKNIEFLGSVSDWQLSNLYSQAQAVIFPQSEDFGMVPLEAMASGRPVIAFRSGGALETIIEGTTGLFFDEQTSEALEKAVKQFQKLKFDSRKCRAQAEKFSIDVFKENFNKLISESLT